MADLYLSPSPRAARRWRVIGLLPLLLLLTACGGPKMSVTRALWRGVIIENTDTEPYMVERVIANGSPENSNCNNYPNRTLAPGESHTVVFLLCGNVRQIEVETDHGSNSFAVEGE